MMADGCHEREIQRHQVARTMDYEKDKDFCTHTHRYLSRESGWGPCFPDVGDIREIISVELRRRGQFALVKLRSENGGMILIQLRREEKKIFQNERLQSCNLIKIAWFFSIVKPKFHSRKRAFNPKMLKKTKNHLNRSKNSARSSFMLHQTHRRLRIGTKPAEIFSLNVILVPKIEITQFRPGT